MRIAVLADIHGNLLALEAVRADLRSRSPDLVVNLGDHVSGPLWAAETADLLMSLDWIHIRGNHDRQLLDRPYTAMGASDQAALAQLRPRHLAWLAALLGTVRLDAGVFLCHGTPASDVEYLLEEVTPSGTVQPASPLLIQHRLGGIQDALVLCGHTHIPRVAGGIANPGSVGLPAYDDAAPYAHCMEAGSPHARYAVADLVDGLWLVTPRVVEYDWEAAAQRAAAGGRADWACALRTGRALRAG